MYFIYGCKWGMGEETIDSSTYTLIVISYIIGIKCYTSRADDAFNFNGFRLKDKRASTMNF